jgi:predicted nucleic acid-binding protein
MKKILIDTNGYVAFKKGDKDALQIIRKAAIIGFSVIVLGELLAGFSAGNKESTNREELRMFLDSPRVVLLNASETTSEFYAKVFSDLKQKGKPIPTNDLWIAATALENGYAIFTHDHHFKEINGLLIGSKPSDLLL